MTATELHGGSPWLDPQSEGAAGWAAGGVDEDLLDQLAVELGGKRADAVPTMSAATSQQLHRQYSVTGPGQPSAIGVGGSGFHHQSHPQILHQNSLPLLPSGLSLSLQQQLQGFGSAPDQAALPNSLNSISCDNNLLQPAGQPVLMFRPAFGNVTGVMAGAGFEVRPAGSNKSHSPSTSSGGAGGVQGLDEGMELCGSHRPGKTINKGALAQKRFRERQKVGLWAEEGLGVER